MPAAVPRSTERGAGRRIWAAALAVGTVAAVVFAWGLPSEPPFVDEYAYLSQSYFADLWWKGKTDHPAWLDYPAYDLPPLPKYAIGLALRAAWYRPPLPSAASAWYADTSSRFGPPGMLTAARRPSVLFGAVGVVALFGLGAQVYGLRAGVLAALLLTFNPLYRLHARRAMSDVPAEALMLLAAALALWAWRRTLVGRAGIASWSVGLLAGIAAGLATLAKLNGALAMFVLIAWTALALGLPRVAIGRKLAVVALTAVAGAASVATFVLLNPFLTARPRVASPASIRRMAALSLPERALFLAEHRLAVPRKQKRLFPHNALNTPLEQVEVVAVQGFGRFGPFGPRHSDSTRRFDASQDAGALIWLPCVVAGVVSTLARGRAQWASGEPPTAWAIVAQATVILAAVTAYLPLAWDRYFLSLQPVAALLVSGAAVAALDALVGWVRGKDENPAIRGEAGG